MMNFFFCVRVWFDSYEKKKCYVYNILVIKNNVYLSGEREYLYSIGICEFKIVKI